LLDSTIQLRERVSVQVVHKFGPEDFGHVIQRNRPPLVAMVWEEVSYSLPPLAQGFDREFRNEVGAGLSSIELAIEDAYIDREVVLQTVAGPTTLKVDYLTILADPLVERSSLALETLSPEKRPYLQTEDPVQAVCCPLRLPITRHSFWPLSFHLGD